MRFTNSGHPVELPDLSGLKISEADRAIQAALEHSVSGFSGELKKAADNIVSDLRKGR